MFDVTDLKYVYRYLVNSSCSKRCTIVPEVYSFIVLFEVKCFYRACYFGKHLRCASFLGALADEQEYQ